MRICSASSKSNSASALRKFIGSFVTLPPMIAVGARRLHDTNRSGWWQLLALIPFGVVVPIILLAQKSIPPNPAELPASAQL
ncbi:MAG: hypothetical protein DMG80_03030 [Acidobacteria bacterium]|nr:MAG: hypothetical protein DMG80_03030 [Acidobacteriota bacterium]